MIKNQNEFVETQEAIKGYKVLLQCWKNIVYATKKDGSAYAIMSKNFKNATYSRQKGNIEYYQLQVNGMIPQTIIRGVECFNIGISDRIICSYWFKNRYEKQYTLEDIKKAINRRIIDIERTINTWEQEINVYQNVCE